MKMTEAIDVEALINRPVERRKADRSRSIEELIVVAETLRDHCLCQGSRQYAEEYVSEYHRLTGKLAVEPFLQKAGQDKHKQQAAQHPIQNA